MVGPKYEAPISEVPSAWKTDNSSSEMVSKSYDYWWQVFDDPYLNSLIDYALYNNNDLHIAAERILQARAQLGMTSANLYPQFNLQTSEYASGMLFKFFQPPGIPPIAPFRTNPHLYLLATNLNYELDFWGKLRYRELSSYREWEAQQMAFQTAVLILTTDLAASYFELRLLDSRLELFENTLLVRKNALEVNQERYNLGLINFSDVTRAETLLYNAEAEKYNIERLRAHQENLIATLLGIPASNFSIQFSPLYIPPPQIPAGVPSDVIKRRPDVHEAERQAAAEHALIGEAYASFFPSISLTGALGYSSPDLRHFLTLKSRTWTLGVNSLQPLFDGFRLQYNLDRTYANFNQASANYQQTVLKAFQEVEDALISLKLQAEEMQSLQRSLEAAKLTTEFSSDRYLNGLVNYLDVTESEHSQLTINNSLLELLSTEYSSTIQLIKALGGSWNWEITNES